MAKEGKTIWVSGPEYFLLSQGKDLLEVATGLKFTWGAYLTALSFGSLAAQSLSGVLAECPECGHKLQVKMVKPKRED